MSIFIWLCPGLSELAGKSPNCHRGEYIGWLVVECIYPHDYLPFLVQQSIARQKKLNEYEREHGGTAVYGINQFSDLTPEEFRGMEIVVYCCLVLAEGEEPCRV